MDCTGKNLEALLSTFKMLDNHHQKVLEISGFNSGHKILHLFKSTDEII